MEASPGVGSFHAASPGRGLASEPVGTGCLSTELSTWRTISRFSSPFPMKGNRPEIKGLGEKKKEKRKRRQDNMGGRDLLNCREDIMSFFHINT